MKKIFLFIALLCMFILPVTVLAEEPEPEPEVVEETEQEPTLDEFKAEVQAWMSQYMEESLVVKIITWMVDAGVLSALFVVYLKYRKYKHTTIEDLTKYLIDNLAHINGVTIFSSANKVGIVSFSIKYISSIEISEILSSRYDICVRGGFHCAPLVHRYLKTDDDGLTRISLSPHNTKKEIDFFINALKEIIYSI